MTNQSGPFGGAQRGGLPTLPKGDEIARYDTYEQALQAVDLLARSDFAVQAASIVGNDMKSVERVTGRLSWGRAAGAGAISGIWLGLFFGLMMSLFSAKTTTGYIFGAVLIGAAFGMLFGLASYALTRRRKDFSSVMQVLATSYSLVIAPEYANRARNLLGIDAFSPHTPPVVHPEPPQDPTA